MKRRRRILLLGSAALLLLVGALAGAALLIPEERVAAAVAARAEAILGERVRLQGASLRLLPLPGVRLTGLSVGGTGDSTALAAAGVVELRARLLPLLRGDVVIGSLVVEEPRVLLEIDASGRPNLPNLGRGDAATASAGPGRDIRFAIDRIAISDGRLALRDLRDGSVVRLDGWDQRLRISGEVRAGRLAAVVLEGWLSFDDVDARLPRVVLPVENVALRLTHDATLDRVSDRLDLRALTLDLDGVGLGGSGLIDSVSSATGRSADLRLAAEGLDAARLVAWVPEPVRTRLALDDGRRLEPGGSATVEVGIRGPLRADTLPGFDGTLSLTQVSLSVGRERLLEDVRGGATFSADSVVARFDGRALGEPFNAELAAHNPAAPALVLTLRGRGELGRLRELGLLPDTMAFEGAARVDVRARVLTRDPARSEATGTVELTGFRLEGGRTPLAVPHATLTFEGRRLRAEPVAVRLGDRSDIRGSVVAEGWIAALVDSAAPPPRLQAMMEFDTLDLDALLGTPEGEYPALLFARLRDRPLEDGRSAADAAEAMGLALPALPPVDAEVSVTGRRLVRNGTAYSDIDAVLAVRPDAVELRSARFGLMGGTVQASGRLEPTRHDSTGAPVAARLVGRYALERVGAAPFFDRLTPFRDHLTGSLGLAGTVSMLLDHHALPDRDALAAAGDLALADGYLANWRVVDAAAERLGLTAYDTVRFRGWAGAFSVTGPLVTLSETMLEGVDLSARAAGSFDLGGRLDLGATLLLSREVAARAGAVGQQLLAAAGTGERLPVGLTLRGNVEDPRVSLDLSAARENVVARARDAAEREAQQLARRAREEALEQAPLPDSLRGLSSDSLRKVLSDSLVSLLPDSLDLPGDSATARIQDQVQNRLRGLLRGGGQRPAVPDSGGPSAPPQQP